jgi:hypothetical protein
MRMSNSLGIFVLLAVFVGCADRQSPGVEQLGGGHVDQSQGERLDWPPSDWPGITADEADIEHKPPMSVGDFDFGQACSRPDGCDSDSADWPDCLNSQCNTNDCSFPVFTSEYGFCSRSCTDDTECENALPNGPYGDEFKCLTDGVSGTCAPGSNARCDYERNGQCEDPDEACKYQLIFAPDTFYGAVCQPRTPDGRELGEACDEEAGVYCANDMCLFDTCTSFCDPNAATSICPAGYTCFEEWYPFGTDSSYNVDICMPEYCETESDCPDDFSCVLGFQFNRNTILRGICLPKKDGAVSSGGECCTSDACIAQNPEVECLGATCSGQDDGIGYCAGMCNDDNDCPGSAYCTIINFGINAEPGSAPAQICQEGSGSGRPCQINADCAPDGDTPQEACDYVIRGELDGGRVVSDTSVGGRCASIPLGAVEYGADCGNLAGECTNSALCLSTGGNGFCSEPCRNTSDCDEGSLCYGLGLTDTLEGGACIEARLLGMTGASLATCRRDADCVETEHCGLNIISGNEAVVETMCMTNEGAGSPGSECGSGMDCKSGTCAPLSTDSSALGYCLGTCRSADDCGDGFSCERQVVDAPSGGQAKVCRPAAACVPCAFDNTAVCGTNFACSQVEYPSAGPGAACLEECDAPGAGTCADGFSCAP